MTTLVLKFGGTSVSTRAAWLTIQDIIRERQQQAERVVIVVSALSQVSNTIEKLLRATRQEKFLDDEFADLLAKHHELANALALPAVSFIDEYFVRLRDLLLSLTESRVRSVPLATWAKAMSYGEIVSSLLGYHYLKSVALEAQWLYAAHLLLAQEENHLNSSCIYKPKAQEHDMLAQGSLFITQGFIARNNKEQIVLMGRGGSDTSATLLSAGLSATRCELWSNVPGFYSTDPRRVAEAKLIKALSYEEAQEIALMGAKVMHPRAIAPLVQKNIPLHLRSTVNLQALGTVVSSKPSSSLHKIKAITVKRDIMLLHMESIMMWRQSGFLADIFTCFKNSSLSIDLISTSEASVSVSLDKINADRVEELELLVQALRKFCFVETTTHCASISLVGKNIRGTLHKLHHIFSLFDNYPVYLLSQSANNLNLTFVVPLEYCDRLTQKIHQQLFADVEEDDIFGDSWFSLQGEREIKPQHHWWQDKQEQLLKLVDSKTPARYVYNLAELDKAVQQLRSLTAINRIFYAVKANNNPSLLARLQQLGIGFECVSLGELQHIKRCLPDLSAKRVLFTPNFCAREEYEYAIKCGYQLTVDNMYVLQEWGEIFTDKEFILRIDPGHSRGHHKHVITGGSRSKFGIVPADCQQVLKLADKYKFIIKGLHAHAGSGIFSTHDWRWRAERLVALCADITTVKILNLGGGFGVPEHARDEELNLSLLSESLIEFKCQYPQYEIWIEPGRYLVAQAGVLLARVNQLKHKQGITFVGISTGMNSLIRPALYDAYHEIVNLSRLEEKQLERVEIVGPICESGDNLGRGRKISQTFAGDVLLIANAGAYGAVMSSSYNLRPPATETVLPH